MDDGGGPTVRLRIGRTVAIAAFSGWLLYAAFYAVLFALSGSTPAMALRGALANAIPDGLLALAAFTLSRRLDGVASAARGVLRVHAPRAVLLVGLAGACKVLLLWLEATVVRGDASFHLPAGIVAWQVFISALLYVAVAASTNAWLIARRLREEEARAARADALRARAELSALRAQLNPHFLFNTLHSVLGMVRRDPALAESALEDLGDLLRYAMRVHRDGVDWTPLRNEWEFMGSYVDLETIRLGDRLRVTRRADEAALDQSVPTFSLQPLVENAVRHGIAPRAAGGRIEIEAQLEGDTLRLTVSNDMDGASAAAVESPADEGGIGLRVLRDRLDVLYRGRARMTAGPTAEGGYRVVLTLPASSDDTETGA